MKLKGLDFLSESSFWVAVALVGGLSDLGLPPGIQTKENPGMVFSYSTIFEGLSKCSKSALMKRSVQDIYQFIILLFILQILYCFNPS